MISIKLFIVSVLCLFSGSLITIKGDDFGNMQCYMQCYPQLTAWAQSYAQLQPTAANYWTYYCSQLWVDWVVCLRNTCGSQIIPDDTLAEWNSFVEQCTQQGSPITIPGFTGGTGTNNPTPTIETCNSECAPVLTSWSSGLDTAITSEQNRTVCTTSWAGVQTCVSKNCPKTGYGAIETDLTAAQTACKAKGYDITFAPATGGNNLPPPNNTPSAANSIISVNSLSLIVGSLVASIALLLA
jgi:hypothetical protein